jgi:hypothetical protein
MGNLAELKQKLSGHTLVIVFCAIVITWMVTEGDWNLFAHAGYLEGFYDGQAASLLQGRLDVTTPATSRGDSGRCCALVPEIGAVLGCPSDFACAAGGFAGVCDRRSKLYVASGPE